METGAIAEKLIEQAKGLTDEERRSCLHEPNIPYLNERIAYHSRMARRQLLVVALLVLFALASMLTLLIGGNMEPDRLLWLKGGLAGYLLVMLLLMPKSFKNHSRIAAELRILKELAELT